MKFREHNGCILFRDNMQYLRAEWKRCHGSVSMYSVLRLIPLWLAYTHIKRNIISLTYTGGYFTLFTIGRICIFYQTDILKDLEWPSIYILHVHRTNGFMYHTYSPTHILQNLFPISLLSHFFVICRIEQNNVPTDGRCLSAITGARCRQYIW